jgi:hypothetical protein
VSLAISEKMRYGLYVFNFSATFRHIRLLVMGTGEEVILKSLQLPVSLPPHQEYGPMRMGYADLFGPMEERNNLGKGQGQASKLTS